MARLRAFHERNPGEWSGRGEPDAVLVVARALAVQRPWSGRQAPSQDRPVKGPTAWSFTRSVRPSGHLSAVPRPISIRVGRARDIPDGVEHDIARLEPIPIEEAANRGICSCPSNMMVLCAAVPAKRSSVSASAQ